MGAAAAMDREAFMNAAPMTGVRVLDSTRFISGPMATMMLADLGCTVIKVEHPVTGDETRHIMPTQAGLSHFFASFNRNKRSVGLDLRTNAGRTAFLRLAANCDVVVENFRPGVSDALGIGYSAIQILNPNVVYCAISGFGTTGELRDRIAFNIVVQAMTGVMSLNGERDGTPLKLGLPMADLSAANDAARAVAAAMYRKSVTGNGALVEISLFDSLIALTSYYSARLFATGLVPERIGNDHHSSVPYGVFATRDSNIVIAAYNDKFYQRLVTSLGAPGLADDPRFATALARSANRAECIAAVNGLTRMHTTDELMQVIGAADVPCAPVLDLREALEHPHSRSRGVVVTRDTAEGELAMIASPIRFPLEPPRAPSPPPRLAEHTEAVLREVAGYSDEELAQLYSASGAAR